MADFLSDHTVLSGIVIGGAIVAFVMGAFARGPSPAEAFTSLVHSRYACKEFSPKAVPDDVLRKLMDLTLRAPTSFNTQPWIAVVVRDADAKGKLVAALAPGNQPKAASAPVNIVFAADTEPEKLLDATTPDFIREALPMFMGQCSTPEAWAFKQTMTAAQTFMLAATAHGLATNPMEGFRSIQAVRDAVGLPSRYGVPVVVSLGYEKAPRAKIATRKPVESMWHHDSFKATGH